MTELKTMISIDDQKEIQASAFKLIDDNTVDIINDDEKDLVEDGDLCDTDGREEAFRDAAHKRIADQCENVHLADILMLVMDSVNWSQHPRFESGPLFKEKLEPEERGPANPL